MGKNYSAFNMAHELVLLLPKFIDMNLQKMFIKGIRKLPCILQGHRWNYNDFMQGNNLPKGEYVYRRTCNCKNCNKQKVSLEFSLQFGKNLASM